MNKTPFDVICDIAITVCMIVATCLFLYMGCTYNHNMKQLNDRMDRIEATE